MNTEKFLKETKESGKIKSYHIGYDLIEVGYHNGWDVSLDCSGEDLIVFENLEREDTDRENIIIPELLGYGNGQGAQAVYGHYKTMGKALRSLVSGNWASGRRTKEFYV